MAMNLEQRKKFLKDYKGDTIKLLLTEDEADILVDILIYTKKKAITYKDSGAIFDLYDYVRREYEKQIGWVYYGDEID